MKISIWDVPFVADSTLELHDLGAIFICFERASLQGKGAGLKKNVPYCARHAAVRYAIRIDGNLILQSRAIRSFRAKLPSMSCGARGLWAWMHQNAAKPSDFFHMS